MEHDHMHAREEALRLNVTNAREQGDPDLLRQRIGQVASFLEDTHGTVNYTLFAQILRDVMSDEEIDSICMELSVIHAISAFDPDEEQQPRDLSAPDALPMAFGTAISDTQQRYELRRFIGQGTQGTVYEAHDRVIPDPDHPAMVAIKILRAGTSDAMAISEASMARRLNHPGIARVFDAGQSPKGEHYIAYELLRGPSLDDWRRSNEPLSPKRCVKLVQAVCEALIHAHAQGVVHRDIKPSNIIMADDNRPVITDFGIAHAMQARNIRSLRRHGTRGSLAFMAPEQFNGATSSRSVAVDVYACGGILLWLLTGNYPNGSDAQSACDYLANPPQDGPTQLIEGIDDPRLRYILSHALTPDTQKRYATLDRLHADLARYTSHEPIPGLDEPILTRVSHAYRRDRKPFLWGGALAACAACFLSLLWWGSIQSTRRESRVALELVEAELQSERQEREQIRQKAKLVHQVIQSWSEASDERFGPENATANLLFLHSVAQYGPLTNDDATFVDAVLNDKVRIAEQYLAHLESIDASPVQMALWHDLIAYWGEELTPVVRREHLMQALTLVRRYAPDDAVWIADLEFRLAHAEGELAQLNTDTTTPPLED
ncbi:MAG: serine/threonine-protein kinase [Phycisphaerales bacterium]